jgi:hypothetical protein
MEEWRAVPGYEGFYDVSSEGRVRSLPRVVRSGRGWTTTIHDKILRERRTNGYVGVNLCRDGQRTMTAVHRVVGFAFLGLTASMQVNHLNGVKTDNRVENLEVVTSQENIAHACRTGLRDLRGTKNHKARLSAADVLTIRARLANGESQSAIARDYPVKVACIAKIERGTIWRHVA